MEFQWSYFKSWKMMLWKCCTQYASKCGKLSSGHRTGKGQFSFQSQRRAMPKNAQTTVQLHSSHMLAKSSLSITNSWNSPKLMSIESVMPSSHLILCHPLLLLPPIPPSIRVFTNESTLHMRWPKCWRFSFSISPSNEHPGLISFRMDLLDLLAVQGTLKSLLQHHSSKAPYICVSILYWCFSFWLTSLFIIGSSFIHLIRTDSNVFFLMAE